MDNQYLGMLFRIGFVEWRKGEGQIEGMVGWHCGMAERQNGYDRMAERRNGGTS
jgi:hypothetical protein